MRANKANTLIASTCLRAKRLSKRQPSQSRVVSYAKRVFVVSVSDKVVAESLIIIMIIIIIVTFVAVVRFVGLVLVAFEFEF